MICDVNKKDIRALNDSDLRDLIGRLCIAELNKNGESASGVTFGGNQDASDGGVDVRVEAANYIGNNSYIPRKESIFQVKKPKMGASEITAEMMPHGMLRKCISDLAANYGAYIIVSSGDDCTDSMLQDRKQAMRKCLAGLQQAERIHVDFYDCSRIACWANSYPSAAVWIYRCIGKNVLTGWKPYESWSGGTKEYYFNDDDVRFNKYPAENRGLTVAQAVNEIRSKLLTHRSSVRLTGLSGVGKTRLLEALFDESIGQNPLPQSLALYADMGHNPDPSPLHLADHLIAFDKCAILLVDNCSPEDHRILSDAIRKENSRLSLITVEYDVREDVPPETDVYVMEPASKPVIEQLIKSRRPDLYQNDINTIVDFSGGNARIAIALTNTCRIGETIHGLSDSVLIERLLYQRQEHNDRLLRAAKALSLVYSFNGSFGDESGELHKLSQIADTSEREMYEFCNTLEKRALVQVRMPYKALLPHALANRLAKEALQSFPEDLLLDAFTKPEHERLLRSFSHRLGYLHSEPIAARIARKLLDYITNAGYPVVSESMHCILEYIAPVIPADTMRVIAISAATGSVDTLLQYHSNVNYIQLTAQLAYIPELFDSAIKTFVQFMKHEKKHIRDSVKQTLMHYFQLYLSGTKATPEQRRDAIHWMLCSDDASIRKLGAEALRTTLATRNFVGSGYTTMTFGAHSRDYGYYPEGDQITEWYRLFIHYACDMIASNQVGAGDVKFVLAQSCRGLCAIGFIDEIEAAANVITAHTTWFDGWVACISILRFDSEKISIDVKTRILALKEKLQPISLQDKIRAYTLTRGHPRLYLEYELASGKKNLAPATLSVYIKGLGKLLGSDETTFGSLLPELIEQNVDNGTGLTWLGEGFAGACTNLMQAWSRIKSVLTARASAVLYPHFISGYYRGACKESPTIGEKIAIDIVNDTYLRPYALLLFCDDISDGCHERLLKFLKEHPEYPWRNDFFPNNQAYAKEQNCIELVDALFERGDNISVIIQLLRTNTPEYGVENSGWSKYRRCIMEHMTSIQFDDENLSSETIEGIGEIIAYAYDENGSKPQLTKIANNVFRYLNNPKAYCSSGYVGLLTGIATADTYVLLDAFLPDNIEISYNIAHAFYGSFSNESVIEACELNSVKAWIDKNPSERLSKVAGLTNMIKVKDGAATITNLAEYVIDHDYISPLVLNSLQKHIEPSSWSGNLSDILEIKKAAVVSLTKHRSPMVSSWAFDVVDLLNKRIRAWAEIERSRDAEVIDPFEP